MRFRLPGIILLLLVYYIPIKGLEIRSKVFSNDNAPIEDAIITDGKRHVRSSSDGTFRFETNADSLYVSKLGYARKAFSSKHIPAVIFLISSPIELSPIVVTERFSSDYFSATDRYLIKFDPQRSYVSNREILSNVAGVSTNDTPLIGESQYISLLGNLNRHTLVMLDGVPLNAQGEAFDLSRINPDTIERIEVIKNNASVYGGGSAIGGIIAIHSKRGLTEQNHSMFFKQETGSYGYVKNLVGFENNATNLSYFISFSDLKADNNFSYKLPSWWNPDSLQTVERENNVKTINSVSANLSSKIGHFLLTYQTNFEKFKKELPGPTNFLEIYQNAFLTGLNSRSNLQIEYEPTPIRAKTIVWINSDDTQYDNTNAPLPVFVTKYQQKLDSKGLKAIASYNAGMFGTDVGYEYIQNEYNNIDKLNLQNSISKSSRQNGFSLKNTLEYSMDLFTAVIAVAGRLDHADSEDYYSWRVEALFKRQGLINLEIGSTIGTSFALPSMYDLYWKGDAQAIGNPDLVPETSKGYQYWIDATYEKLSAKISYHQNSIDNMIQWRQVSMNGPSWKPFNIQSSLIQNVESQLFYALDAGLEISINHLYTIARDKSVGIDGSPLNYWLMYTPKHNVGLGLDYRKYNSHLWLRYKYLDKQWTTKDNLIDPLKAYSLTDVGVSYSIYYNSFRVVPHLNLYNIFSTDYQIFSYVPQPGINWVSGVSLAYDF